MIELSRAEARQIAMRAQWADADRPASVVELVDQVMVLQVDPTSAIAPSVDLVCWSRLGAEYDASDLRFAIETERSLVEHGSYVRPMSDIGAVLGLGPSQIYPRAAEWIAANASFRGDILALLDERGPLASTEIPDTAVVGWESSGWTHDKNVVRMLELLMRLGEVAISGRRGKFRTWDLPERVYPTGLVVPGVEESARLLAERLLGSLGVARGVGRQDQLVVGEVGLPCRVEGSRVAWRVDPAAVELAGTEAGFEGRAILLSPFDRLVHDRDRLLDLFDFDYALEMYKPAAKRRWGYFALPIGYDDELIGKLDAKLDRTAGVLRVNAVHADRAWTADVAEAVEAEIDALAEWLDVDRISATDAQRGG